MEGRREGFESIMRHVANEEARDIEHEPRIASPERRKIKRELTIVTPKDFELDQGNFGEALRAVSSRHHPTDSVEAVRARGADYTGKREYPESIIIRMREIVGTESPEGWAGLVEGVGEAARESQARPQTLEQAFTHAQAILAMKPGEERNEVLNGIELAMHDSPMARRFFVDSDGRHRMFTLKGLSELGCDISISGMKVAVMR